MRKTLRDILTRVCLTRTNTAVGLWRGPALLLAALIGASGASAQDLARDEGSGFGVSAPPGYVAQRSPPQAPGEVVFIVALAGDNTTGCRVSFQPQASFARLTQEQLNTMADEPKLYRDGLADSYAVDTVVPFEVAGVRGADVVADLRAPTASDFRARLFLFYTPKGPVRVACIDLKANADAQQDAFVATARSLTFPR